MTYDEPAAACVAETPKAICVTCAAWGGKQTWIPKSVVHDDSEVFGMGDEGKLVVHVWWAEQEGWL